MDTMKFDNHGTMVCLGLRYSKAPFVRFRVVMPECDSSAGGKHALAVHTCTLSCYYCT